MGATGAPSDVNRVICNGPEIEHDDRESVARILRVLLPEVTADIDRYTQKLKMQWTRLRLIGACDGNIGLSEGPRPPNPNLV